MMLEDLNKLLRTARLYESYGKVEELLGLSIQARMRDAFYGEKCLITSVDGRELDAEVKGFRDGQVILLPYGDLTGLKPGSFVRRSKSVLQIPVSQNMLGRLLDGMGRPIDGGPDVLPSEYRVLRSVPMSPMERARIQTVLETGVKAIDTMLTMGRGQRLGIFAGAGVGKSSLLGMLLAGVKADVTVVALIGERGREVKEFLEEIIPEDQRQKTIVVTATADEPALVRVNAAFTAMAISEYFRDQGLDVFLAFDSLTRFAMAQREVGLAVGEPPTAKGYTPSVFALLPELVERAGAKEGAGSISAVYTLLVEGEEAEDPVAESARAILDGHIVLSRTIANEGRYPAINFLESISRLANYLQDGPQAELCRLARRRIKDYQEARDLVALGAYSEGKSSELDLALKQTPGLLELFMQRGSDAHTRSDLYRKMAVLMGCK